MKVWWEQYERSRGEDRPELIFVKLANVDVLADVLGVKWPLKSIYEGKYTNISLKYCLI